MFSFLLPLILALPAFSQAPKANGFRLKTCSDDACYEVEASKSHRSLLEDLYVLEKVELKIISKNGERRTRATYVGADGYYDPANKRVVLRNVPHTGFKEVSQNLETGEIHFL